MHVVVAMAVMVLVLVLEVNVPLVVAGSYIPTVRYSKEVQVQVASHRYHMVPTCLIFACIVEEKKALSCYLPYLGTLPCHEESISHAQHPKLNQ